jgi:thymidylate synthase
VRPYLDLLRHVLDSGAWVPTRAVLPSTRQKVQALTVFGTQSRYDLAAGFPLVTTKRVPFKAVAVELLWFLSGSTNVAYLEKNGVAIWQEWADQDGELGPVYGKQWRAWPGEDGAEYDQILMLQENLRRVARDPSESVRRRLILTAWNVAQIRLMRLPPCHMTSQFNVVRGRLSCQLYQRSADLFLGVPFNIASYALLTHMLAHAADLAVGELVHTIGDAHVYENHLEQVKEQLSREPKALPSLRIAPDAPRDVDGMTLDHFLLEGYSPHPAIKGEVAV